MSEISVEALYSYPVKSCAPISHSEFAVTEQGLEFDREWVVTRPNGTFLSQRNFPELALVRTAVTHDSLVLSAPSNGSVTIPLERDQVKEKQAEEITIFEKTGTAYDEDEEASTFFSDFLGKQVILKRSVKARPIKPEYRVDGASMSSRNADGFPFLLTSAASLELLSAQAGQEIAMARFRPNIVIAGDGLEPYVEDYWREVQIGKMRAFVVKACDRCPIPDVNPETGLTDPGRPVNKALQETRSGMFRGKEKVRIFFGQNLVHMAEPGQRLQVGDKSKAVKLSWRQNFEPLYTA